MTANFGFYRPVAKRSSDCFYSPSFYLFHEFDSSLCCFLSLSFSRKKENNWRGLPFAPGAFRARATTVGYFFASGGLTGLKQALSPQQGLLSEHCKEF